MQRREIAQYLCSLNAAVVPFDTWGETAFFYDRDRRLHRGVYFATLKSKDDDNDRASDLDRPSVFRLNPGMSKASYQSLFGKPHARPAGGMVDTGHDFTALDTLLPHPVYAWMRWMCFISPSSATFDQMKPLIAGALQLATQSSRSESSRCESYEGCLPPIPLVAPWSVRTSRASPMPSLSVEALVGIPGHAQCKPNRDTIRTYLKIGKDDNLSCFVAPAVFDNRRLVKPEPRFFLLFLKAGPRLSAGTTAKNNHASQF